ncbi:MAG: hypothetical protein A2X32_05480 [Elusimicrobia bacterium GWC2_64_44]|nr:MAG: hypothetical protein A2X32_05480 [Elusimicrobia bacterium GWC2_64_44]
MKNYRLLWVIAIVLALLGSALKLWHQKREREWQAVLLESDRQDAIRVAEFGRRMGEFQAKGLINNAGALKSELGVYYNEGKWNGPDSKVMLLAEERYKRSPKAGLMVFEELCRVFDNNAEMSEWISEDFNTFAYKDPAKFARAAAGLSPASFDCLPKYLDLGWAQGAPEDVQPENDKLLAYLRAYPVKGNPNVRKLITQLEYLRK